MLVDVFAKPSEQLAEITLADLVLKIPNIFVDLLPQLNRNQIPKRVGGEVADRTTRPMNVLQHSSRIVRRRNTEVLLHFCIPDLGQILDRDDPFHYTNLEFQPEH